MITTSKVRNTIRGCIISACFLLAAANCFGQIVTKVTDPVEWVNPLMSTDSKSSMSRMHLILFQKIEMGVILKIHLRPAGRSSPPPPAEDRPDRRS